MADGFLGRWSQRKQAVREGKALQEPIEHTGLPSPEGQSAPVTPSAPSDVACVEPGTTQAQPRSALTLEDVDALNSDASFAPFVSRNVSPEVRNAAMKKLFTDPHYNVMDRLDIYIDDYSLADPMPAAMLRQMASAQFLNLFDEEPASASVTPSENTHHDHTDLRLQPDDAAGLAQSERVSEPTPDAALKPVPPRSP